MQWNNITSVLRVIPPHPHYHTNACCVAATPPGPLAIAYAYYDKDAPTDVTPLLATHPEYDNHVRALVVEAWG